MASKKTPDPQHTASPHHGHHAELRYGGMSASDVLNVSEGAALRHKGRSITPQEGKVMVKMQRDLARTGKMTME